MSEQSYNIFVRILCMAVVCWRRRKIIMKEKGTALRYKNTDYIKKTCRPFYAEEKSKLECQNFKKMEMQGLE